MGGGCNSNGRWHRHKYVDIVKFRNSELIGAVLFIIPRTGMLGTLLLIAYMGGAMATHMVLGESFLFPALIQVFVWVVACIRFPELPQRMLNGSKRRPQLN